MYTILRYNCKTVLKHFCIRNVGVLRHLQTHHFHTFFRGGSCFIHFPFLCIYSIIRSNYYCSLRSGSGAEPVANG